MTPQEAKTDESSLIQTIRPPEEPGGTIPLEVWDCTKGWKNSGFGSEADAIASIVGLVVPPLNIEVQMVRTVLLKFPSEVGTAKEHLMIISIHHAISDEVSNRVILRDLLAAYRAYANGAEKPKGLPDIHVEYADYAVWQWQHLVMGGHLEWQREYWMKQLASMPTPLSLPFDRPRSETDSGARREGAFIPVCLPGKLVVALEDLCVQHRSTMFVGLMAAFQLTLSRLAGNVTDLVVGAPIAGRDDVLLHDMVGCIVETLAIRGDLKGHPSFSTLLERQRLIVTDAFQNANVPLSQIAQCLQVPRIANCHPVYQVCTFVCHFLFIALLIVS